MEVTICDLQIRPHGSATSAHGLHRTRRGDALQHLEQPARRAGEHRNHARLCAPARSPRDQPRTGAQVHRVGTPRGKSRRADSGDLRSHPPTSQPTRTTAQADRVSSERTPRDLPRPLDSGPASAVSPRTPDVCREAVGRRNDEPR